ncbi:complement C5-like [Suricata suricatta]|uniref:complement C5-like n=1 Tax=Suricata suricatta TaxID=37032 RepID=UPI001155A8FB|nr:complement C5-like [Suricata suricatta]
MATNCFSSGLGNYFLSQQLLKFLDKSDQDCESSGGRNNAAVFHLAGLTVLTNANGDDSQQDGESLEKIPRSRRELKKKIESEEPAPVGPVMFERISLESGLWKVYHVSKRHQIELTLPYFLTKTWEIQGVGISNKGLCVADVLRLQPNNDGFLVLNNNVTRVSEEGQFQEPNPHLTNNG